MTVSASTSAGVNRTHDDPAAARARLAVILYAVGQGDREALEKVYALTSAKLFGICLRICGDRDAAEDVLQDVYVKIWRQANRFDAARASPITWLATIARNTAIDWRRARRPEVTEGVDAAMEVADDRPAADAVISAEQERGRISDCLDQLEQRVGTAIRSAFFGGFTYAQLAVRDGVPLGTMKTWVRRGLMQLKACLSDG